MTRARSRAARAQPDEPSEASPAEVPPQLGPVLDFMRLMWQVEHRLQRASRRIEASFGVTGPQRLVLRIVGRFPGIPAGHLSRLLHIDPSTLSGTVKRLERQGLLRRRADPRDGRRWLLGLTDSGMIVDVECEAPVEAAVSAAIDGMTSAQLDAARGVLTAIARALADREG